MKNSKKLFTSAKKYIPGGVNSPVRAFSSVNSIPFFIKKAKGQYLIDEDNKKYVYANKEMSAKNYKMSIIHKPFYEIRYINF